MGIEVLAGLLDEKLIKIISLFIKYPDRRFYLSEVSRLSGVNNATTFRMLNKLSDEQFLTVMLVGKVRMYQLSKGEKANSLSKLLRKTDVGDPITLFCKKLQTIAGVRKALLDSKSHNTAKLIIITDRQLHKTITALCKEFQREHKFKVSFIELTPQQYEGLRASSTFNLDKKTLF